MAADTMNISLPGSLKKYVEKRVSDGGYGSASEYFRDLVRLDQHSQEQARLEALLLERLGDGQSAPFTDEDMKEVRRALAARLSAKSRSKAA